jgi:hypothetical protein
MCSTPKKQSRSFYGPVRYLLRFKESVGEETKGKVDILCLCPLIIANPYFWSSLSFSAFSAYNKGIRWTEERGIKEE